MRGTVGGLSPWSYNGDSCAPSQRTFESPRLFSVVEESGRALPPNLEESCAHFCFWFAL